MTQKPPHPNAPIKEWAVYYRGIGLHPLPVRPGTKFPAVKWTEYQTRKPSLEEIERWNWSGGIGIVTTGLVCVDCDGGGEQLLKGKDFPPSWTVRTGSGGLHRYYKADGQRARNAAAILKEDGKGQVDIRADGGFIIVPPTRHIKTGKPYEWILPPWLDTLPLAPVPAWIQEAVTDKRQTSKSQPVQVDKRIPKGQRNNTLTSLAGTMWRRRMDEKAILVALLEENAAKCDPPLPEHDVRKIAHSVARYEPEKSKEANSLPSLLIPAREFLERPRAEQAKLIPRLGGRRGGKLGLYGPGGSGKSYTFLNVAVAAANGNSLLEYPEWTVAAPLRVAFISLEDPADEQNDRLSRLLSFYELSEAPEQLFIFDRDLEEEGFILAGGKRGDINERAFRRLDSCLGDHKIDLLLIEPKRYLVEVDENSSTENMPWQRRLQDLLIRHGTLAFIGHHAGWDRDGKIHARGTTVFRDWVDGMIQQTEDQIQGKPGFLMTCNKSNFAARWNPISILFDPETGGMRAVDETTGKLPPALLRTCFEEHGGAIESPVREVYQAIAQYANCSEATARRAIEGAIKDGWLQVRGRGKGYGLCAHGGSNG